MQKEVWKAYHNEGVQVIGISVPEGMKMPLSQLRAFRKKHGVTYPLLIDPKGEVATRFGVTAIPLTVVLNRHFQIVGSSYDWKVVRTMIQHLLAQEAARKKK